MPQNDFLVWAGGSNANVLSQAGYAGLGNLTSGVVAGKASGQQANKTWRQSSIMAAMLAQFIVDRVSSDVVDDGTIGTIETNFIRAIQSLFVIPPTGVVPGTYGPTIAIAVQADGRVTSLANANLAGTGLTPGTYVAPTITVGNDGRITGIVSVAYGPLASANTWAAKNTYAAGVTITGFDNGGVGAGLQLRAIGGNFGAGIRNDGASFYLLQTASGQQNGVWNGFRPFAWNLTNGVVTIDGTGAGTALGGTVTVASSGVGVLAIGTSGQFYLNPNNGGNQLINFAANQYLQFQPGVGFVLNTTGFIHLNGPANVTVSNGLSVGTSLNVGTTISAGGNINTNGSVSSAGDGYLGGVQVGLLGDGNRGIDTQQGAYLSYDIDNPSTPAYGGWFSPVQMSANNFISIVNNSYQNMYAANFVVSSDIVNKTDVRDVSHEDAIAFVNSITAKKFVRNGQTETGFVAQDIQEHDRFEHMVRRMGKNDDETSRQLGLSLADPIAYHHTAIKLLMDRVEALEKLLAERH